MSHNTHEGIRNLSSVSSISLALLFFYFIARYQHEALLDFQEYIEGILEVCSYATISFYFTILLSYLLFFIYL